MAFDEWPVRQPGLFFAGMAYPEGRDLDPWRSLDGSPANEDVIRNLPIRHPLLRMEAPRPAAGTSGRQQRVSQQMTTARESG